MTVIVINEESHGFLGVAKDYKSAVEYLYQMNWLNEEFELSEYNFQKKTWDCPTISEKLGPNWLDIICSWTITEFNDYFEGMFTFWEEEVWEG